MLWIPLVWLSPSLPCVVKWGFPTVLSRWRPGWAIGSTRRPAPLSPSHRLTQKTNELWLSHWKLSGPITVMNMMISTLTGEATSWVQSWWFIPPSWRRQRLKNWTSNQLNFEFSVHESNKKFSFKKKERKKCYSLITIHFSKKNLTTLLVLAKQRTEESQSGWSQYIWRRSDWTARNSNRTGR